MPERNEPNNTDDVQRKIAVLLKYIMVLEIAFVCLAVLASVLRVLNVFTHFDGIPHIVLSTIVCTLTVTTCVLLLIVWIKLRRLKKSAERLDDEPEHDDNENARDDNEIQSDDNAPIPDDKQSKPADNN